MVKVLASGFYTSIQDLGRFNFLEYGVPYSGVMDAKAAVLANLLVGNNENAAVLEITMTGPKLQFLCDTLICVTGADLEAKLNNLEIKNNNAIIVKKDDILSFGRLKKGFRAYISVLGGFKTPIVMNSRSMFTAITDQNSVNKGDTLQIEELKTTELRSNASLVVKDDYLKNSTITVQKGPEYDKLSDFQQKKLNSTTFTVSKNNSRMAYQLTELLPNSLEPIITSVVLPGTVQLTPSGQLIILMKDCQTTGGYPRVLQLSNAAINTLAQKFTGDKIAFEVI